ncbi:hypothetical protein LTR17_020243 [Elasticomyces elasticus]|nr:hypothetical protein LTR17_020243 [Elasticomyces elasticus]
MVVDNEIKGRLALVTGASGGIGAACSRDLHAYGTRLALTYSTNKNSLDNLVAELLKQSKDLKISTHQCDVAKEADLQRLFDEVKHEHGQHPDILVANAGYGKRVSNILDIALEEWDYAAGGTSINGCHYSASKAGVQGMSKNLANKMSKEGITFNDVAPAMITGTGMIPSEENLKDTPGDVKNIPVGRSGHTTECANVVTMLCRTGYMTGQSILLSGGLK